MKKILVLILALVMTMSLTACGSGTEDAGSDEIAAGSDEIKDIISNEELVGTWISEDGTTFSINIDGTIINESLDMNISFRTDEKYVQWEIEGDKFVFQETAGTYLKYQIVNENEQLKLKYLEMDGAFVGGYMVEPIMTDLVKQD